jgi:dihydrofolate synthase/folylpolyglutamate synthase
VGGWQYISKQLGQVQCHTMRIVFGMVDDKDIEGVLELLPKQAVYYFTKADSKRAMSEDTIQALAARHGLEGTAYPTVREAYESALKEAAENDFIFVGGSSYVVGDFLRTCN